MKNLLFIFLLLINGALQGQVLSVYDLSCEHRIDPVGISVQQPRLSWKINASQPNTIQTAYQLKVGNWESGKIASGQSVLVPYTGTKLQPQTRYSWQVKVWDNHNNASAWSSPAFF